MGKIGDLFVRLGLKKSEFDRGMDEAAKKATGFGSKLGTIVKGAAAGFGVVTVAVGVLAKALGDLSKQNQTLGDNWNRTIASMKAAWDSFKIDVANTDFTGAVKRARNAAAAAADYYNAKDWETEVENANRLIQAEHAADIEEWQEIARDVNRSNKERVEAIQNIMRTMEPVYANTIAQNAITAEKSLNKFISSATGQAVEAITEDARKAWTDYVKWQGQVSNRAAVEAADAVNAAKKRLAQAESNEMKGQAYASIGTDKYGKTVDTGPSRALVEAREALAGALKDAEDLGVTNEILTMRQQYNDRLNDDKTLTMVGDVEKYLVSMAAERMENRRLTTLLHSLEHQDLGGGIETPTPSSNGALEAQRRQAERIAKEAAEYQLSERTQLKKHYEEEKALLEQFGIDTAMLTLKYHDADAELLRKELAEDQELLQDQLAEFEESFKVELEPFELGPGVQEFLDELTRLQEEAEDRAERFKEAMVSGFSAGIEELTDQLFGLSEVNAGSIVQALLTPLADMAQQEGELLIAQGVGIEAIKTALESLNGVAAIAAGTALVAVAATVKSGLSRIAQAGGNATGIATTCASDVGTGLVGSVQDVELTVKIEGSLKGSDIVLAAQRTEMSWSR